MKNEMGTAVSGVSNVEKVQAKSVRAIDLYPLHLFPPLTERNDRQKDFDSMMMDAERPHTA